MSEAEYRCPRDATGQLWRRETLRDPYREIFVCPGCGDKTGILAGVLAHFCEGAEAVAAFKEQLERAIWEARREGYEAALADLLNLLAMDSGGGRGWTVEEAAGFVQQRMDDNRDERVEKPWLGSS